MRSVKLSFFTIVISLAVVSCGNDGANRGASTPIDSTNVKGAAPATYGGNNPANDENPDSNRSNTNDTGTKANNVHNSGTR
jgi:hypothetical protein